jgi:hypothetical protein
MDEHVAVLLERQDVYLVVAAGDLPGVRRGLLAGHPSHGYLARPSG